MRKSRPPDRKPCHFRTIQSDAPCYLPRHLAPILAEALEDTPVDCWLAVGDAVNPLTARWPGAVQGELF